jgi:hypothetical protein
VDAVAASLGSKARTVAFGDLALTGCDWHPSLADHEKMAALIAPLLR